MSVPAGGVIDAHHHLWDPGRRRYPFLDPPEMAPIRRPYGVPELRQHAAAAGVERTVVVQAVPTMEETRELLHAAAGSGGLVAGVVGWVDLAAASVADDIAALCAVPGGSLLVGIRHLVQDEADPEWLVRSDVLRGLREVAASGLAYDLLVRPHQVRAATAAARQVPGGRFVLDHAAKPPVAAGALQPWADLVRDLASVPSTYCKVSGLVTEASWRHWTREQVRPYVEHVLSCFGPDRLMLGSDWPVCELAATYEQVLDLARDILSALRPEEREDVLSGTAVRAYRLADPATGPTPERA